jgi:predicted DNA-binding transcriptional regulator AlpA
MTNSNFTDVRSFGKALGINQTAAYELVKRPGFPSIRIGKRLVILQDRVNEWLEAEMQKEK